MKKLLFTAAVIIISLAAFAGCASSPRAIQGYAGEAKTADEVMTISYDGSGSFKFIIFKVDGKVTSDPYSYGCTYNSPGGKINLQLLPGQHEIEFNYVPVKKLQTVTFTGEAGKEYEFITEKESFKVVEKEGKTARDVEFSLKDVPYFKEAAESEPHALLVETGSGLTKGDGVTVLFRIDGFPGPNLPIGGIPNYMINKPFSQDYSVRLAPGEHTLEFYGRYGKFFHMVPQTQKYNFEAGRKYTISYNVKKEKGFEMLDYTFAEVK